MSFDVATHSEADTIALGKALGPVLRDGDVLALRGDLGAGKTHFVQGIAQGMMPLVSLAVGEGDREGLKLYLRRTILSVLVVGALVEVVCQL